MAKDYKVTLNNGEIEIVPKIDGVVIGKSGSLHFKILLPPPGLPDEKTIVIYGPAAWRKYEEYV